MYKHVPKEAQHAALVFFNASWPTRGAARTNADIRAIVDHARAVRLRCDALSDGSGRIIHGLARHASTMTRRSLPWMPVGPTNTFETDSCGIVVPYVTEAVRDAAYDLLSALIMEVR